jgi:hypothetical protein
LITSPFAALIEPQLWALTKEFRLQTSVKVTPTFLRVIRRFMEAKVRSFSNVTLPSFSHLHAE